jgi:hypothetical protein
VIPTAASNESLRAEVDIMSLDDRAKAIIASNLTTACHVEIASRQAILGHPIDPSIPKEWACGHSDASEEVFNTYLGFLRR